MRIRSLRPLLISLSLVSFLPSTTLAAESKAEPAARAALDAGRLAEAADLYLEAHRETSSAAHARQAGLIFLRLGPERAADARYAFALYARAAKTPAEQQEAKDLMLIAEGGAKQAAPSAGAKPAPADGTRVTTETAIDTAAGTVTQTETTQHGSSSTAVDAANQKLTHSETDAEGTRSTAIDARGQSVTYASQSADGKETVNATANSQGASYEKNVDCSKDPKNEVCEENTKLSLADGGLKASFQKTEVKKLVGRHKNPGEFRLGASFTSATMSESDMSSTMFGATGSSNVAFGKLPNSSGGSFAGLSIGASAGISYGSFGGGIDGSMTQIVAMVPVGLQLYRFSPQNPKTLKQPGLGLFLGYAGGLSATSTSIETDSGTIDGEDKSFAHGPRVNISFPSFNPGTSKMSGFGVSAMVLPLEAATMFFVSAEWVMGQATPDSDPVIASR